MIVTTFHCVKRCSCSARGIRQPLLTLTVRDAEEEAYSPERISGADYKLMLYPFRELDSLVVCPACHVPWTMTVNTEFVETSDAVSMLNSPP